MPPVEDTSQASDSGDAIKVFVRVRPPAAECENEARCLEVDKKRHAIILQSKPEPKVFTFDHVADTDTQQETVFACVGKKMIECCVGGYNGTIFAYGQTGSGKTFTMLGPSEDQENFHHELRGVIPRSFEFLFNIINRQKELHGDKIQFLVKCSFIEIYNEQVFDLLDPACKGLQLRENIKKGVFVEGIIEQSVVSAMEAYEVLSAGWMNRTVAATSMNRESSRSHAVFTVTIESKENVNGVWNLRSGQLHLVDLAGSERQKDTHTLGIRLKEAGSINKSLSVLGNVIMSLVDIAHGKQRFVPYRDSKLSFLLRDSLGGNAKTCIIANVHPGTKCCGETLSTLQFVRRAKMIKNKAVKNENSQGSVAALQAEILRLKEIIAHYEQGNPSVVSTAAASGDHQQPQAAGAQSEWRQHFLTAMTFRQHAIIDANKAAEAVKRLNQVLRRKEEALSQTKMILKFRQEALAKMLRAQKDKGETDEKDEVIAIQREEIKALEIAAVSNPDLAKCNAEKGNLKAELDALIQRTKASAISDSKQAEKLEEIYAELVAGKEKEAGSEKHLKYATPQSSSGDSNVSVATLERLKSQNAKLQEDIKNVKEEKDNEVQKLLTTIREQEAKLASMTQSRDELQKCLKNKNICSQIERETTDNMHVETIKVMTTPKKYNLRNRTVVTSENSFLETSLSFSPDGNDSIIEDEAPPQEMVEEHTQALAGEIQVLKDELRKIKAEREAEQEESMTHLHEFTLLKEEKRQMDELYATDLVKLKSQSERLQHIDDD